MSDPRRERIRHLFGYAVIPEAELDEITRVHDGLAQAAFAMHDALERISALSPYVSGRPAIALAREAMAAAEKAVAPTLRPGSVLRFPDPSRRR
jgi:hypothetical protein